MNDPVIDEIRKSRTELAERAGNDLNRFADIIAEEERLLEETGKYRFVSELRVVPAESLNESFSSPTPPKKK